MKAGRDTPTVIFVSVLFDAVRISTDLNDVSDVSEVTKTTR